MLGDAFVERTVRATVTAIRAEARVKQFVVLPAQRRAEERLRQALVEATGGPPTTAS